MTANQFENPEISKQKQIDNEEYNKPLNIDLETQKNDLKSLFGEFVPSENKKNVPEVQDPEEYLEPTEESIKGHEDNVKYKEIQNSTENNDFSNKDLYNFSKNKIRELSGDKGELENIKILSKYVTGYENNRLGKNKNEVNEIRDTNSERIEKFEKVSTKVKGLDSFLENSKDETSIEFELFNMIGRNYIGLENGDKESVNLAIENAGDYVLNTFTNIPESESKRVAIKKINGDSTKNKIEGIKTLYLLASVGAASGAKMEKVKKWVTDHIKTKKIKMSEEYFDNNKLLKSKSLEKKDKEKIENKQESLGKEANEIEDGEVFKVGKLDVNNKKTEKKEQD